MTGRFGLTGDIACRIRFAVVALCLAAAAPLWAASDGRIPPRLARDWQPPTVEDLTDYLGEAVGAQTARAAKDEKASEKKRQKMIDALAEKIEAGGMRRAGRAKLQLRLAGLITQQADAAFAREQREYAGNYEAYLISGKEPPPRSDHRASRKGYLRAVDAYRDVLESNPKYNGKADIILELGLLLALANSPNALPTFEKIMKEHAGSPAAARAALGAGEIMARAGKPGDAKKLFVKAAKSSDSVAKSYAGYRLLWLRFQEQTTARELTAGAQAAGALEDQAVKSCAESDARNWLCEAARDDLAFFWSGEANQEPARSFFDRIHSPERYQVTLERVAWLRQQAKKPLEVAETLGLLLEAAPAHKRAPALFVMQAEAYDQAGKPALMVPVFTRMHKSCLGSGAWADAYANDKEKVNATEELFRKNVQTYGLKYHQLYAKSNVPDHLATANGLLALFVMAFPTGDDSYVLRYTYAENLVKANQPAAAAAQYYTVAKADSLGKRYREPAAEKMLALSLKLADAEPQKKPDSGAKLPAPLPPPLDLLTKAVDLNASVAPQRPGLLALRLRVANIRLDYGHYADAASRFDQITKDAPDAPEAIASVKRLLGFYTERRAWDDVIKWSSEFAGRTKLKNKDIALTVRTAWINALWEKAEGLAAAKKPEPAAVTYITLAKTFANDQKADQALAKASAQLLATGQGKAGVAPCLLLAQTYPKSALRASCLYTTAEVFEQMLDYANAGQAYANFAAAYPQDLRAPGALLQAAQLFVDAQNTDLAAVLLAKLAKQYPKRSEAATGLMMLGDIMEKVEKPAIAVVAYDEYTSKYAAAHPEEALFAEASAAALTKPRNIAQGEKRLAAVTKKLPSAGAAKARTRLAAFRYDDARRHVIAPKSGEEGGPVDYTELVKVWRLTLKAAEEYYGHATRLRDPEYSTAAHYQAGLLYEKAFIAGKTIAEQATLPPSVLTQALALRENFILEAQRGMNSHWEAGLKLADANKRHDEWERLTRKKMARLAPGRYTPTPEMMVAPQFTSHKLSQSLEVKP